MKKKVIITLFIIIAIIILMPKTVNAVNTSEFFSEDITFNLTKRPDPNETSKGRLPYGLYTPSTATENEAIPLIVWLGGSGEIHLYTRFTERTITASYSQLEP